MRRTSILHRKPRSRRDRVLFRLDAALESGRRRWHRLRSNRRLRAAHARAEHMFVELGKGLGHQDRRVVTPAGRRHPHLRHHR